MFLVVESGLEMLLFYGGSIITVPAHKGIAIAKSIASCVVGVMNVVGTTIYTINENYLKMD